MSFKTSILQQNQSTFSDHLCQAQLEDLQELRRLQKDQLEEPLPTSFFTDGLEDHWIKRCVNIAGSGKDVVWG